MTTVDPNKKAEWDAAARAATEHQLDVGDPPPRHFREKLFCTLSEKERLQIGLRSADAVNSSKERFEAATRALAAARKQELTEEKVLADAFRTGRIEREVDVVEMVSYRLGRKWKMRKDTGENFDEKALSADERQGRLPVDNGQLNLGDAARGGNEADDEEEDDDVEEEEDDLEEPDEEPEPGASIDNPEGILEEATRGESADEKKPKKK